MQDTLNYMKNCLASLRDRGWDDSRISTNVEIKTGGDWTEDGFYVYPSYLNEAGKKESIDGLYVGSATLAAATGKDDFAAKLLAKTPPIKEHQTKVLLEHIAKITELAAALRLSPDFLNPITAMADLLRTNILTAPPSDIEIDWENS